MRVSAAALPYISGAKTPNFLLIYPKNIPEAVFHVLSQAYKAYMRELRDKKAAAKPIQHKPTTVDRRNREVPTVKN